MKRSINFALVATLALSAAPAFAQGAPFPASSDGHALVLHQMPGYSWGSKTVLNSPDDWLCFGGQTHRKPGDGDPVIDPPHTLIHDLAHDHAIFCGPAGAELDGNFPLTVVIPLKTFHLAGRIDSIKAFFAAGCNQMEHDIPIQTWPFPLYGNPSSGDTTDAMVSYTFKPQDFEDVCVPKHGWFGITTSIKVIMDDNLSTHDTEITLPYYSMLDPSAPEAPLKEGGVQLAVKTTNAVFNGDGTSNVFGIQLIESQHPLPIYGPISVPVMIDFLAYAYSICPCLPAFDSNGNPLSQYQLIFGADLHDGIPGVQETKLNAQTSNGLEFHDILRPSDLTAVPAPMGYPPNRQKVLIGWTQSTGDGFFAENGGWVRPNELIETWLDFNVEIDPNWSNYPQVDPVVPNPISDAPPPPVCMDPNATNFGQLGECTYPTDGGPLTLNARNLTVRADGADGAWMTVFSDAGGAACRLSGGQRPYSGPYFSAGGYAWFSVGDHQLVCWGNDATGQTLGDVFTLTVTPQ